MYELSASPIDAWTLWDMNDVAYEGSEPVLFVMEHPRTFGTMQVTTALTTDGDDRLPPHFTFRLFAEGAEVYAQRFELASDGRVVPSGTR